MMTMFNQCAGGAGHRAFYLNPENNVGNGATPDSISESGDELRRTSIPDSTTTTTTTTGAGATPDPATETESTATTH